MGKVYINRTAKRLNLTAQSTLFIGDLSPTGKGLVRQDRRVRTFLRLYSQVISPDKNWFYSHTKSDGHIRRDIKAMTAFLAAKTNELKVA